MFKKLFFGSRTRQKKRSRIESRSMLRRLLLERLENRKMWAVDVVSIVGNDLAIANTTANFTRERSTSPSAACVEKANLLSAPAS